MKHTETNNKVVWHREKKKSKAPLIVLLVIAALLVIVASGFFVVRHTGKLALRQKTESVQMNMAKEENLQEYDPDAVKYQGEIYHYNKDMLTFLVMGIDKMTPVNRNPKGKINYLKGGQADALFLVSANPHTKEVFVIGINRNAMASIEVLSEEGQYLTTKQDVICVQHGFGTGLEDSCERQVRVVSELLYNLPISGYAAINMGAVSKINDAVGGVELPLLHKIPKGSALLRQPEGTMVTLKGKDAFDYLHNRDVDEFGSANKRLERQKQYANVFIPKAVEKIKENPSFVVNLYNEVSKYMVTDITLSQAVYLATELSGYTFDSNHIYTLEGETVVADDGFEQFYVDDDALYDLIMKLYYEKVQ